MAFTTSPTTKTHFYPLYSTGTHYRNAESVLQGDKRYRYVKFTLIHNDLERISMRIGKTVRIQ